MPFDLSSLPPSPTPDQVAKFVVDAAADVVQTMTTATTTARNSVDASAGQAIANVNKSVAAVNAAVQTSFNDLRANSDRAKNDMQSATDRAMGEFQRLVSEVLKLVGRPPTPTDLAVGDVNGELFYEPLGCFV